ncbi:MAG: LamG domain-containing protein, partial [Caldilinea sp.]
PLPATATMTPAPSQNNALTFDGIDDVVVLGRVEHGSVLTVEFWVRPASSSLDAIVVNQADDDSGWSFELNAGRASFWVATNAGWQVVRHATRLVGGRWYHVAATYNDGSAQVFVNGRPGTMTTLPSGVGAVGELRFGGIPGYDRFVGALDDVRISQVVRYAARFTPPVPLPAPDADTLGQWTLNEGSGQMAADSSAAGNPGQLGLSPSTDAADPAWEATGR